MCFMRLKMKKLLDIVRTESVLEEYWNANRGKHEGLAKASKT